MTHLFMSFFKLGQKIAEEDEDWEYTEEPHSSRRKAILKKHPEIKKLMGYDPFIAYVVTAEIIAQIIMAYLVKDASWPILVFLSYLVSATLNHSLGSAIHEIGHNLAFGHGRPIANRILGMCCNLPMAIPMSVTYKIYHSDHHRYLGHDSMDVDVPTRIECFLFRHPLTKCFWLLMHPAIHGIRPFFKSPKPPSKLEMINIVCQITFDVIILKYFGFKAFTYLVLGTFFGLGFHPLAGHFISEHYMFTKEHRQATHSYYGPLNPILFNVGYHVEHHDFPYVSYRKLPEVRRIAHEFYKDLPYHTSWFKVLYDFIMMPDMGPIGHGVGYHKTDCDIAKKEAKELNLVGAHYIDKKTL